MIESIMDGLLNFFYAIIGFCFGPFVELFANFMIENDLTGVIGNFNNILITYIAPAVGFFFDIIPPMATNIIIMEIKFYILVFMFNITFGFVMDVLNFIKKIPFA